MKKILLLGALLFAINIIATGQKADSNNLTQAYPRPYKDSIVNIFYNQIFCDNLNLFAKDFKPPYDYPFDILFSENSSISILQKIIDDSSVNSKLKLFAYSKQRKKVRSLDKKELLGIVIEIGLKYGLTVLAAFNDETVNYINSNEKLWNGKTDTMVNSFARDLFIKSRRMLSEIPLSKNLRISYPEIGYARITFLTSDGVYSTEEKIAVMANYELTGPAFITGGRLMQYLSRETTHKK